MMLDAWVDIEAFGTPYNCNMVYLFLESVAVLLKEIDPIGVENRKRRCLHRREYSSLGPKEAGGALSFFLQTQGVNI